MKKQINVPGMHILIGCAHAPFHNKELFKGITSLIKDHKPVGLHLIGDFLDCNSLSSHDSGKFTAIPGLNLDSEYAEGNRLLDSLLSRHKFKVKSYLYGNHEHRYFRYMADMESAKRPLKSPTDALRLKERGFVVLEQWDKDYLILGRHLELMHGIYFNVHAAKKHMDVLRSSIAFAHTHRIQSYIEGETGAFNIGCSADISSPAFGYASRAMKSQWQNGFAVVNINKKGDYYFQQVIVYNDHFVFGGKQY